MKLVRAEPDKFELPGEFKVPKREEGMYWSYPVVTGGRLYVRHADQIYVYDVGINTFTLKMFKNKEL